MSDPFIVHTPEQLTAEDIANTFVDMYTDFPKLKEPVNMFIHGARGAGKSIMLRSLEYSVQKLLGDADRQKLPFFAVHVPIKDIFFANPEYRRLKDWKATTVGEHLLCVYVVQHLFQALSSLEIPLPNGFVGEFSELWEDCGGVPESEGADNISSFSDFVRFCSRETSRVRQYYVRLPKGCDPDIYSGALTSFSDFLLPIVQKCQEIESDVVKRSTCFMVDDADNLPEAFQRVLNSWISTRTAAYVCFKVTTQLGYKTYKTVDNRVIESPHDFSEVNIGSVYTSSKGNFSRRIKAIVEKRLRHSGVDVSPEEFFPADAAQEVRKQEIWDDLISGKTDEFISLDGVGPKRTRDLAQRYAIPSLMRELASSRSSHTYSYAGLQSLTDLSSGVVRWFLEPAGQMYHEVQSGLKEGERPTSIPVGVQDSEILKWSRAFREKLNVDPGSAEDISPESSLHTIGHTREAYLKLGNLLDGIGQLCRERLLDRSASEQRVFSFAISDEAPSQLEEVLHLGVRLGYLQKADLAAKNALGGRRPRYILSRRLGPHYRLDVSGYAAHLSVTSLDLLRAMDDPKGFVRRRLKVQSVDDGQQIIDFGG